MQLVADIGNIELAVPRQLIGASYGDAFMAAVGVGRFNGLQDITRWVKNKKIVNPNPAAHEHYALNYNIFRSLYEANRPLMHELADSLRLK